MANIAAFFDIDGTLYRDSLLIEHFRKLIQYGSLTLVIEDLLFKGLKSL
ncbi:MAG: HAD-IB family hydrolase, partial [Peptostreptococcus sp.]